MGYETTPDDTSCTRVFFYDFTIPSFSVVLIWFWVKEKRPYGLSLAAIIILARPAVGLMSSPAVAEVSVS